MIDLRSDTVTLSTDAMRHAMAAAEVGDDVYGDDPTVAALEADGARLASKEAALFFPSGTQANLVALMTHCQRVEEYLVGQKLIIICSRQAATRCAAVSSLNRWTLPMTRRCRWTKWPAAIKPDDFHFARTRLLSLENTHNRWVPQDYMRQAWALTRERRLALHIDGAWVFNAAVVQGIALSEISQYCDTLTICLSKGLGAPMGSLLCDSEDYIARAWRGRKMLGGGRSQAGILAAAARYALAHHVTRLQEDHDNARWLAQLWVDIVAPGEQTNMLFIRQSADLATRLTPWMRDHGIIIASGTLNRLVAHFNVSLQDLKKVVDCWRVFLAHHNKLAAAPLTGVYFQ